MSTRLLADLEKKITEWITENCGEDDWPYGLVHPALERQMASAAYSVFAACNDGQEYAKQQSAQHRNNRAQK